MGLIKYSKDHYWGAKNPYRTQWGVNDPKNIATAKSLNIPYVIPINDEARQLGCDAREAELQEVSGPTAVYRGVCQMRHEYDLRIDVKELQKEDMVESEEEDFERDEEGNLSIGGKGSHEAEELESY
jgi:hypothetical protein